MYRIGIDVGGTFTDLVAIDSDGNVTLGKTPSTPEDQSIGVMDGLTRIAETLDQTLAQLLAGTERIVHGTTVATNALLERKGAKVGLLTTDGHRDVLEMREGLKPERYNLRLARPDATDEQLDFPSLWASGRDGYASPDATARSGNLEPLFKLIVDHVPAPGLDASGPFSFLATLLDRDNFMGRVLTGRVQSGTVKINDPIRALDADGNVVSTRATGYAEVYFPTGFTLFTVPFVSGENIVTELLPVVPEG